MAFVYANDPAGAFALSSQLDQQRVGNFLNSIQANRQAQLQGFQAASQQAQLQDALQQRQQQQMLELARLATVQQAEQQRRQEAANQFAQTLGLSQGQLAELIRHNQATEEKPNASHEAILFKQQQEADKHNQEADYAAQLADLLNKHAGLQGLLSGVPTSPEARSAAVDAATGAGFQPEPGGAMRAAAYLIPGLPSHNRAVSAKEAEVKQNIAAHVADLPADFSGANSIEDYAKIAAAAINNRLAQMPKPPNMSDIAGIVGLNAQGQHVPMIQRIGAPAPVPAPSPEPPPALQAAAPMAPAPAAQPSLPVFRNEGEIKAANVPRGSSVILWDPSQKRYRRAVWD